MHHLWSLFTFMIYGQLHNETNETCVHNKIYNTDLKKMYNLFSSKFFTAANIWTGLKNQTL